MSRERFLLWECEKVKRKEKGIEKRALEGRCGSVRTWDLEKSGFCFCIWGKAGRRVRFYLRTWLEVKTEEQPRFARHNIFRKILFNFNLYVIVTLQMDGRC